MLWYNFTEANVQFVFIDSPPEQGLGTYSIYTNRTIAVNYACNSWNVTSVTANGTGNPSTIEVLDKFPFVVSRVAPKSMTFYTEQNNTCSNGDPRCSFVEVFEAPDPSSEPASPGYFYQCNITVGTTQNDGHNVNNISDEMAFIAASSIAQQGYSDSQGQQAQMYPFDSIWGQPAYGDTQVAGMTIATFAMGSIAGAFMFNPDSVFYSAPVPGQGQSLDIGHPFSFYLIIGLLCAGQLLFAIIVAFFANRVMVGPDSYLDMSLLLRPIADKLHGVSGGEHDRAFIMAKKDTMVQYEKSSSGRWILNISSRT